MNNNNELSKKRKTNPSSTNKYKSNSSNIADNLSDDESQNINTKKSRINHSNSDEESDFNLLKTEQYDDQDENEMQTTRTERNVEDSEDETMNGSEETGDIISRLRTNEKIENDIKSQFEVASTPVNNDFEGENDEDDSMEIDVDPELLKLLDDSTGAHTIEDGIGDEFNEAEQEEEDEDIEDENTFGLGEQEPEEEEEEELIKEEPIREQKLVMDIRIGNIFKMDESTVDVQTIPFHPSVKNVLEKMSIVQLFPVQRTVIPFILQCEKSGIDADICIGCPTGSGKTLAYLLPIVDTLISNFVKGQWRALIIVPTVNLAQQVAKICADFSSLEVASLCGITSFQKEVSSIVKDSRIYTDIIIATPGSLLNHLRNNKYMSMMHLQFIVMDEVDRLLEPDTLPLMQQILKYYYDSDFYAERVKFDREFHKQFAPPRPFRAPRKILCSATMTQNPGKLELVRVSKPQFFTYLTTSTLSTAVGDFSHLQGKKYTVPTHLYQHALLYRSQFKPLYLFQFLKSLDTKSSVLLFTGSKKTIKRLQMFFKEFKVTLDLKVAAITKRNTSGLIKAFNQKKIQVLICTDNMARGIDLPSVDYVVNYELPSQLKTYVHRIGRTARANQEFGDAITMCSSKDEFDKLEELLKEKTNTEELNRVEFDFKDLMMQYRTPYIQALQNMQKSLSNK